jgi:hypothetical protein
MSEPVFVEVEEDFVAHVTGMDRETMIGIANDMAMEYYKNLPGRVRLYAISNPRFEDGAFYGTFRYRYDPNATPKAEKVELEETEEEREQRLSQLQKVHGKSNGL